MSKPKIRSTTVIAVRKNGKVAMAGDGQVTMGDTVMKGNARKVRRLYEGKILTGFAGATADAFNLFDKLFIINIYCYLFWVTIFKFNKWIILFYFITYYLVTYIMVVYIKK